MKIVFVTTPDPRKQGDLLEVSMLHGLRTVLGKDCIDLPRKKVMYHDWSDTTKKELHGNGFTLYKNPIQDLSEDERRNLSNVDAVIYGVTNAYGVEEDPSINQITGGKNIWFLDGHDLYGEAPKLIDFEGETVIGVQKTPCFKRELIERIDGAYPTGFGIPKYQIRPENSRNRTQLYQKTAPDAALFKEVNDLGGSRAHHVFTNEDEYYEDLCSSWFGLTCKKGGWDCLRHYEIIAAGALLLFRDYNDKPPMCSPQVLPCLSYSSREELDDMMHSLVVNNEPTDQYLFLLEQQRHWLLNVGTTEARAKHLLKILENETA
tara:strand:- start:3426 stop:4382 length:957 start_codon:yes stop_codon:yes gene_type:complete